MKFKFCSDGDCPLWALAGLNAVSTLPAAVFKKLVDHIQEEQAEDDLITILKDSNLSSRDECARVAAVIRWTLKSAWRSKTEGSQLIRDLLILGVPRTHATVLADATDSGQEKYETTAKENAFMVNRVVDVSISPTPEEVINSITLSLHTDDVFTGEQKRHDIYVNKAQIPVLLEELKKAYDKMTDIE